MENLLSHVGIFFTMAAVLTFEAILLRLASEPEGGREVKARKGEGHLGAFIRENWYWLLLLIMFFVFSSSGSCSGVCTMVYTAPFSFLIFW